MPIRLARFEMPKRIIKDEAEATETYAKFIAEPFEAGYGRTFGNSLRRVLLSSLEGAAISSVKIEGALHEFCNLPGVVEDVTDIVLNLKHVLLKMYTRAPRKLKISVKGPGEVTAGNIQTDGNVEVLNPDHHIATLDKDGKFEAEFEVQIGRGYCPADWNKKEEQVIGLIPIDSLFSPVTKVNYTVEATRLGQRIDYDKLTLEVWTDGSILPHDAVAMAAKILSDHFRLLVQFEDEPVQEEELEVDEEIVRVRKLLDKSVEELELSVRSSNCLRAAELKSIGDLVQKGEPEMLKFRNFGRKSLKEIQDILGEMGLHFGMDISRYYEAKAPAKTEA